MKLLWTLLNYVSIAAGVAALLYGLSRRRKAPSPVPLQPSPQEEEDIAAIRPGSAPHQVVWSGFMARALIALNLMVALVAVSNAPTMGSTLLLLGVLGFTLRLMWPLITDRPRHG